MNNVSNANATELARVPVSGSQDVVLARFMARQQATNAGFDSGNTIRISTAASELARNIVQHSKGSGAFIVYKISDDSREGLRLEAKDNGVGVPDANALRQSINQLKSGGLFGTMQTSDAFEIKSNPGQGLTVICEKWL